MTALLLVQIGLGGYVLWLLRAGESGRRGLVATFALGATLPIIGAGIGWFANTALQPLLTPLLTLVGL